MLDGSRPGVCVVTQPARRTTGKTHAHQLLDILAASTTVALVTANLAADSPIREDYEVIELTPAGTGDAILTTAYRFIRNQVFMSRAIARRPEAVVLFFGATSYVIPMLVAKAVGKTVVVQPRGDVPRSLRLKWEQQVPPPVARSLANVVSILEHVGYTLADRLITYTPAMAESLGLERYRGKLHTDGARYVDLDRFSIETPLEERPLAVGYLGRLDVEKDVPTLVDVAKQLSPEIDFRFIGDGDYREMVETELAEEIEAGHVVVTGWVSHGAVPDELNRIRLLLLPSRPTEGLPTAILESFACGTPVYATPVSGVPDVVSDGDTGFHMTDTNPDAIAELIEDVLADGRLPEMSNACRGLAKTNFSFEAAVDRYQMILERVSD